MQPNGNISSATEDLLWDYDGENVVVTLTRDSLRPNESVTLRREIERDAHPVIDYDCSPPPTEVPAVANRLEALHRLTAIQAEAQADDDAALATRIDADIAYCAALLGEREPLARYIRRTQGCDPKGWSENYLRQRRRHPGSRSRLGTGRPSSNGIDRTVRPQHRNR
ncbi:hypothetical protein BJY24_006561 [Nocardia transvalensis]|uniref:Uncharacterized protein n=1 Tax=Nocardia transvalensis TaxID=37333 RepID=A0A7W9PK58_9NOCA|nr:hypothetical protein [Nocardia transvalensis]MBB5917649.1 hypothetical protein [Nocardia transvalensis]